MDETAIARFAELKKQIAALEKEMESIKADVFQTVDAAEGMIENDQWILKTQKRPKYKFSEEYEAKSSELKDLRKKEIEDGKATVDGFSEFVTVKFKDPKKA